MTRNRRGKSGKPGAGSSEVPGAGASTRGRAPAAISGVRVVWDPPAGPPDPVFGSGSRIEEKVLVLVTACIGATVVLVYAHFGLHVQWQGWQYALAAVISADLLGGVVANGTNPAKRDHFGPPVACGTWLDAVSRRPVLFAAIHVQPIVIGSAFPGGTPWWGLLWYAVTLVSVVGVRCVSLHLQRPVALAACVGVALTAVLLAAPSGFWWVPVVLALKLTLAHAVQEEPYRPVGE